MNKYAVAVLSFFQNENKILIVEAETEPLAMIKALDEFANTENSEWLGKYPTVEEIKQECFNGEIAISTPILLNKQLQTT